MKQTLRSFMVIVLLGTASCGTQADTLESLTAGSKPESARSEKIFTKNKEFIYAVSCYDDQRQLKATDTIALTSTGAVWESDSTQTKIGWGSRMANKTASTEWSGVRENTVGVWIHPPRFDRYVILRVSPFPEVKLPFVKGQEWDWELAVGEQWANPAWGVWKGDMLVKSHYRAIGEQVVTTPLGRLACQRVAAVSRCSQGSSTLNLLFHPRYGFVELDYQTIDSKILKIRLLSAGVESKFDGGEYFGPKHSGVSN
ncbi:hypothetical protein [Hymenobacter yonginensis]|uniref:Uncharacterized protein n=1 Tax=Hymenobacter yonginensis TaxID=748197 RepID=A0ABY7PSM2_9BACT|nr:hypothetical protein [Hymenobacter yonginensis]WBO85886.1 hypothetical protein O9Z63_06455 [Hymenobacter yonginensis]